MSYKYVFDRYGENDEYISVDPGHFEFDIQINSDVFTISRDGAAALAEFIRQGLNIKNP